MAELSDLTAQCIRCGFCLESCPTYVLDGRETESPRGRIYLVRSMDEGHLAWSAENRLPLDTCLGCRACEPACPSGVRYGAILEAARARFVEADDTGRSRALRSFLEPFKSPSRLRLQLTVSRLLPKRIVSTLIARKLGTGYQEAEAPSPARLRLRPTLEEGALPPVRGEVGLLEGCAMGVLYPDVHEAAERLLRRVGYVATRVRGCCGSLHAHNGFHTEGRRLAEAVAAQLPPDLPLVVDSAGCGSWLKEALPGRKVKDVSEFLVSNGLEDVLSREPARSLQGVVATYHDACHLAHGQLIREEPRSLLGAIPGLRLVPLPEADMCCGSAGVYNVLQPAMARRLLDRKWKNVESTRAAIVASGNPGCHAWIGQAARENGSKVRVEHTLTLLEAAFSGLPEPPGR